MDLLKIKNLKDYREKLPKHATKFYAVRPLSAITHIAIHHSATKTGNAEAFARYHISQSGWPGIGYHFVIEKDGDIKWANNLQCIAYHVGNSNRKAAGICLTGDFREQTPTKEQWNSLFELLKNLLIDLNINYDNVWGHSQFPGYESKACPCIDMNFVRQQLLMPVDIKPKSTPDGVVMAKNFWIPQVINSFPYTSTGLLKMLNPTLPKSITKEIPVTVKGEPEMVPEKVLQIIRAMEAKRYRINRDSSKNYNLNIVGIRSSGKIADKFNDQIIVFWKFENQWQIKQYKATTDPGLTYLLAPINQYGTAILKEGQYIESYRTGRHQGKYKALVQAKPVTIIRDFNRDNKLDFSSGKVQTGFFGINIHRATATGESLLVGKWSAGCQVFAIATQFDEFIKLCDYAVLNWTNLFTYTLLNENDLV